MAVPAWVTAAITLTLTTTPGFGLVFGGASGRQLILNTDGTVSGAHGSDSISGATAGQFTVGDTASPTSVVILVDNISSAGGITVSAALCSYNGGAQQVCDGAGLSATTANSATLLVGLDISTTTAHSGGDSASASFDVSVVAL